MANVEFETSIIDFSVSHHKHSSDQKGHFERGLVNRAIAEASLQGDVVARGQIYIDRRHQAPKYPQDGKR